MVSTIGRMLSCLQLTSEVKRKSLATNAFAIQGGYRFKAPLLPPLVCRTCALLPANKLFQMKASLSSSSMSFSVQSLVGRDCRNIMISWKSIRCSLSDHLTRKAAQT